MHVGMPKNPIILEKCDKYIISRMADIMASLEAKLCSLGIYPDHLTPGHKLTTMTDLSLIQARSVIAMRWTNMTAQHL